MADGMIKLVAVGDDGVGKTTMFITHTTKRYPTAYIPTVFDSWAEQAVVDGNTYCAGFFDSAGNPQYDHLRPLAYPQTDVFLVCFSVRSPASFANIRAKWFPELHHYCPGIPCVLVATQIDTRSDPQVVEDLARQRLRLVSTEEGLMLARELGAARYVECSSLKQIGLKNVFDQAYAAAVERPGFHGRGGTCCVIL